MSNDQNNFEQQKNLKAFGLTAGVCSLLFLLFIIAWTIPQPEKIPPPPQEDISIDVNLGGDDGFGEKAEVPGTPGPVASNDVSGAQASTSSGAGEPEAPSDVKAEVSDDPEATKIAASDKPAPKPVDKPVVSNTTKPATKPAPAPAPPKPKATMGRGQGVIPGGNGDGGNGADSYNNSGQGNGQGKGVMGSPDGSLGGVRIRNAQRKLAKVTYEDNYKNGGKVFVEITLSASGKVTDAVVVNRPGGSPFMDLKRIAVKRAKELPPFGPGPEGEKGLIVIEFENPKG
jgi:TonB family protein